MDITLTNVNGKITISENVVINIIQNIIKRVFKNKNPSNIKVELYNNFYHFEISICNLIFETKNLHNYIDEIERLIKYNFNLSNIYLTFIYGQQH